MKKSRNITFEEFTDNYFEELRYVLDKLPKDKMNAATEIILNAYKYGRNIFIMGNGGSASNASHMACDLGKGTLRRVYDERESRFRVISLTDNVAIMTAFANDLSYEDVFLQQLRNLVAKDDVVIVLSASGNSQNVVKAVKYAKKMKATTIGLLGFKTGGILSSLVDLAIIVDSMNYGHCEDVQLILDHIFTSWMAKVKHHHK